MIPPFGTAAVLSETIDANAPITLGVSVMIVSIGMLASWGRSRTRLFFACLSLSGSGLPNRYGVQEKLGSKTIDVPSLSLKTCK